MEINYLPKKTTYELRNVNQKFPNEIDTPQNKFKEEVKRVFKDVMCNPLAQAILKNFSRHTSSSKLSWSHL